MNRQCWATSKASLPELILRVASILYSRSHWNNLEHVLTILMTTLSSCFKKKLPIYTLFLENYDNVVNPPQLSLLTASALPKFQVVELIQAFGFRSTEYCRAKIRKKAQLAISFSFFTSGRRKAAWGFDEPFSSLTFWQTPPAKRNPLTKQFQNNTFLVSWCSWASSNTNRASAAL